MSELKFTCPSCKQRIEADTSLSGRQVSCPGCESALIIPTAPDDPSQVPVAVLVSEAVSGPPMPAQAPAQAPTPAARPETAAAQSAAPKASGATMPLQPQPRPIAPEPSPFIAPPEQKALPARAPVAASSAAAAPAKTEASPAEPMRPHIAVLTPEIKLDVIRAARARIADESRWVAGKNESNQFVYAARGDDGNVVPVEATSDEATRYSLWGAILLEFHLRNVLQTARGRREFLDEEIEAVVQELQGKEQPGEGPITEKDRRALSHEQSLEVLKVLERRYGRDLREAKAVETGQKLPKIRLAELVRKLEEKLPVPTDDLVSALYHEIEEIRQRLEVLEKTSGKS